MNYIKQLNALYELLPTNPLNANSLCLYHVLLHINNKCNWKKEFTVANALIIAYTGFDKNKLDRARNNLIQKNFIKYKGGRNQYQAGTYEILEFDTANDTASDTAYDTPSDTPPNTPTEDINKLNKTKLNKTKKEKVKKESVFIPPTLEDIKKYITDKGLRVNAEYFYNYFTDGNWVDSNGNKVKSWKQKLLTWNNYNQKNSSKDTQLKNYDYEGDDTL